MSDLVSLSRAGSVVSLTMNDAEHMNLFSPAMRDALIGGLETLSDDPKCRAIVLTGAGDHFSAGGDIKSFNEADTMSGRARLKRGSGPLARCWRLDRSQ